MVGDGTLGVPEHAPYQAIVVSAASSWVPLVEQLADGGRLVHPVGPGGHEQVTAFSRQAERLVVEARLVPAQFVPLVGAYGTPAREGRGERHGHGGAGWGHHAGPWCRPGSGHDATGGLVAPEVRAALGQADLVVLNLECCISDRGRPWDAPASRSSSAPTPRGRAAGLLGTDCVTWPTTTPWTTASTPWPTP